MSLRALNNWPIYFDQKAAQERTQLEGLSGLGARSKSPAQIQGILELHRPPAAQSKASVRARIDVHD